MTYTEIEKSILTTIWGLIKDLEHSQNEIVASMWAHNLSGVQHTAHNLFMSEMLTFEFLYYITNIIEPSAKTHYFPM